jgi:hypothetical protein
VRCRARVGRHSAVEGGAHGVIDHNSRKAATELALGVVQTPSLAVSGTQQSHSARCGVHLVCSCVALFAGQSRPRLGAGAESAAGRAAQASRRRPRARQEHRGRRGRLRWPSRESLGGEALAFDIRGSRRVQSC